jgi:hypothetical protein
VGSTTVAVGSTTVAVGSTTVAVGSTTVAVGRLRSPSLDLPEAAVSEHDPATFDDQLEALGFRPQGGSRRGGRMWTLPFNRYLTFTVHDYHDRVVLTWSFAFGDFLLDRGWQSSTTDASVAEIYPQRDVRLALDIGALEAEITRVLTTLRLDLGDPAL